MRRALAVAVALACAFPLGYLGLLSVAGPWPFPRLLPASLTAARWTAVPGGRGEIAASFLVSCLVSGTVAALATAGGFVTSRYIAYHPRRRTLALLAYVPFALSPVVLGACLLFLYLKAGLAGGLPGVILAQTTVAYGFATVFFLAWWTPESRAREELVHTLGGSTAQLFARVLLPLSRGMLVLCFFQTFLLSWFQYGLTQLVGAGKVKTLPLLVYDFVGEANPSYAALASCLLVLPPVVLLWLNRRVLFKAV